MINVPTRRAVLPAARTLIRPETGLLLLVWLASYMALALLNIWLWEARGAISGELLWWEAQRRLVMAASQPDLSVLVYTNVPPVLYLAVLAGSAFNATALLGATACTALAWLFRATNAPRIWLPLLLLQPGVLVVAAQHPATLLRALLLLLALFFMWSFLNERTSYNLMAAALVLAGAALVDPQPLPELAYLVVALLLAQGGTRNQQTTVLLVGCFPTAALYGAWTYLNWVQGNSWFMRQRETSAIATIFDVSSAAIPANPPVFGSTVLALAVMLAAPLACGLLALGTSKLGAKQRDLRWLGRTLLLGAPLLDALVQTRGAGISLLQTATLPLLALPLLALPGITTNRRLMNLAGSTMLLASLALGWPSIARMATAAPQLAPFHTIARTLNAHLQAGQRVLLDNRAVPPLVALIDRPEALLLPHQTAYSLAQQQPDEWADFVVVTGDQQHNGQVPSETREKLAHYQQIEHAGMIFLFQHQP